MHGKSQLIGVATGVKFGLKLIQEMQIYIHLGESSTAGIYILLQLSMSIFWKLNWNFVKFLWFLWFTIWNESSRCKKKSTMEKVPQWGYIYLSINIFQGHIYKCAECLEIKYNELMTWVMGWPDLYEIPTHNPRYFQPNISIHSKSEKIGGVYFSGQKNCGKSA